MKLKDLKNEFGKKIVEARKINEKVEAEKRDFTAEESEAYDKLIAESVEANTKIQRENDLRDLERTATQGLSPVNTEDAPADKVPAVIKSAEQIKAEGDAVMSAYGRYLSVQAGAIRKGGAFTPDDEALVRANLQEDSDQGGGYLNPPVEFINRLIQRVDDMTFIRMHANKMTVTKADSLGAPELTKDPSDAEWTSELGTGDDDEQMAFGFRELKPHPLAKRIKVSRKLISTAVVSVESLVMERFAYKFAVAQENNFLNGSGSNQPLGVFVASDQGIPTTRDISDGNTSTAITFDGLISAKYAIKAQYWPRARWMFNRTTMAAISKLKDNDGNYLWRENQRMGDPGMILGFPVDVSEYVPNTFTTGSYVGILADWMQYWIVDAMTMTIQRLNELYAEKNQVGFIARAETDGAPVQGEAFARVTLA